MKHCKKLVVKEYSSSEEEEKEAEDRKPIAQKGGGGGNLYMENDGLPKNFIKAHALNRQRKLLSIILKIAKVEGYNDNLQIKGPNGQFMEKSDIVRLLLWAVSQDKVMFGLNEFVDLLKKAGVTADDVLNENLKVRLSGGSRSIPIRDTQPTVVYGTNETPTPLKVNEMITPKVEAVEHFSENAEETYHPPPKEAVVGEGRRTLRDRKKPYDRPKPLLANVSDSE